ncbi:MAG: mechanosensitive ion channel family protein [Eubacteriales bacterium]|nr:mechanosensitive ion channel family protein [Eubacteriales bacterium]
MENSSLFHHILIILGVGVLVWVLIQINHAIFRRIQRKRKGIEIIFFERVTSVIIVVIGIIFVLSLFGGIKSLWRTLLGGTAIVSAVLAFAAQDIIKDILAGLMISMYKPFEIGNRIEMEDGMAGIVMDITMRHVVLKLPDTQVVIVPNSRLNTMRIRNFSYHSPLRAKEFIFNIAYGSDVEKAQRVILQAIIESKYTIPGKEKLNGTEYAPVYFMEFDSSSLRLVTTVYYAQSTPTEVMISDVNLRVNNAFQKYGIEIPFTYINVIQKQEAETVQTEEEAEFTRNVPGVPLMIVTSHGDGMQEAIDATAKLGTDCGLQRKDILRLRLLAEELFGMMRNLVGNVEASYWVWQDKKAFAIHLQAAVPMNRELRKQLLSVSSSGRNEAAKGFMGKIRDLIYVMSLPTDPDESFQQGTGVMGMGLSRRGTSATSYTWSMLKYKTEIANNKNTNSEADEAWDELEKSIVANIADEVRISMDGPTVEIKIFKRF